MITKSNRLTAFAKQPLTKSIQEADLRFDHCYQKTRSLETFLALESRGFSLGKHQMEHPGDLHCRFIYFYSSDPNSKRWFQYLEFSEVRNPEAALAVKPPGSPMALVWEPGLSLTVNENLRETFQPRLEEFEKFEPELTHKNYSWKIDSVSNLSGWNFLIFKKPPVGGIFLWCTEYENADGETAPARIELPGHANSVDAIVGFVWNSNSEDAENLAFLANTSVEDSTIALADGAMIFIESNPSIFLTKTTPFHAVVLTCSNWQTFCQEARPDQIVEWRGRRAGLIKFDDHCWDILVVENEV